MEGIVVSVVFTGILIWGWKLVNMFWLKPKRLERYLRQQGLTGKPYRFMSGDLKESSAMAREACSKPINLMDDITPRVSPFLSHLLNNYGKNCFAWFGPTPRVLITNPEQIKYVLNNMNEFQKPHNTNPIITKYLANGIADYEGEKWVKHRKIMTPAFHQEKLKRMIPAFHQSCSVMINKWEELTSMDGSCEVDVWPYLANLTSDVISRTSFGSSYEEGKVIFELQEEIGRLAIQVISSTYIPGWRFVPTKINKRMKAIDKEIRSSLKRIIIKKEKAMEAGKTSNDDLLGWLLESNLKELKEGKNNKNRVMSIEDVIEECKLFYLAGQETTSGLLVWTMILLARYPEWQSRAREEVFQVFNNKKPEFDGLSRLKVVTMIFHEVLRLYTPLVGLNRCVSKETKLGNLTLCEGIEILLPTHIVHRDGYLWGDDALEFKPERFVEGVSKATKNQVSYFPFGWGPRICIGQNFALAEAKMALALILQHFSFGLSPTYVHAPFMVITLRPQHGAQLILHKL